MGVRFNFESFGETFEFGGDLLHSEIGGGACSTIEPDDFNITVYVIQPWLNLIMGHI